MQKVVHDPQLKKHGKAKLATQKPRDSKLALHLISLHLPSIN